MVDGISRTGGVSLGGRAAGCEVGARLGTTIEEISVSLSVWTWGDLVGAAEGIGVGSDTQGIELIAHVLMGVKIGGVVF